MKSERETTESSRLESSGSETDAYYYRARYYDSNVGRFTSEDPIGFRGGINRFRYARNSPALYIDPLGRTTFQGGVTFGVTGLGFTGVLSAGLATDSCGNLAVYFSWGGGAGLGAGVSGTGDVSVSSGSTVNDLKGPFVNNFVGAGEGLDAGAGTFGGLDADGQPVTGATGSVGAGLGATASVTVTDTTIVPITLSNILGHPPKNDCHCRHKSNHAMNPFGIPIT